METITTITSRPKPSGRFRRIAFVLVICTLAMPASASAFYGSERGSAPAKESSGSGLVIPNHTALNESLAPVGGSPSPGGIERPTTPPVVEYASLDDGFDWADAALGAAATMALVALGGGALLLAVRRHGTVSPSASTS